MRRGIDTNPHNCYIIRVSNNSAEPGPGQAERIKAVVRATYDAAADHFDGGPLSFWDDLGRRTVQLAGVDAGNRVLDVCCGTGASALAAAEVVGSEGRVIGVDFAERLLERARARAVRRGLGNVEFATGDLTALDDALGSFDVVVCAFGIFFAPEIEPALAGLWRRVGPRGRLMVATWGRRLVEPADTIFWEAVQAERPDLRPGDPPARRIAEPPLLARLFVAGGAAAPEIQEETVVRPATPEGFWTMVLGSGYRLPIDLMGTETAERVRLAVLRRMERERVTEVATDVLYAVARRA